MAALHATCLQACGTRLPAPLLQLPAPTASPPRLVRPAAISSRCGPLQAQAVPRELTERITEHGQESYDVYVHQTQPLAEGEEKHVISVFVADESGLINRVAGVFARRGANIESLAVGLNIDKALFTIVTTGNRSAIANLVKQLSKLVKVRYVEDITHAMRVERELVLFKVRAPPGPARTEVLQLVDIFRARVIDVSERTMTLSVTGDAGKMLALQRNLAKFGIMEIARTGKICLKRGRELLEMGGWGDSSTRRASLIRKQASAAAASAVSEDPAISEASAAVPGAVADASAEAAALAQSNGSGDGDVYVADEASGPGVWEVENVLDAEYDPKSQLTAYESRTLQLEVSDLPGVLNQVTGVFARRGYNVQSLAVGNSEEQGMSRITMVIPATGKGISSLIKQVYKLIPVKKVTDLSGAPFVARELMLVKVQCTAAQRRELSDLAEIFHGTICDVSLDTVTLELQGKEQKMTAIQGILQPYGILEIARTGRVALSRDSGVNTKFLNQVKPATKVLL